ncbi:hypothetical protein ANTRET_LOCUS8376 [Anthophora retusa]
MKIKKNFSTSVFLFSRLFFIDSHARRPCVCIRIYVCLHKSIIFIFFPFYRFSFFFFLFFSFPLLRRLFPFFSWRQ